MQGSKKNDKKVIFIFGPTAVGKTDFAIRTAQDVGGEIVSADSMQIYKFMNIGSAKPTPEECMSAKHYMIDEIDPRKPFSVAEYVPMAKNYIERIFQSGKIPIISGGTGLYIHSLMFDMDFGAVPQNNELRKKLYDYADIYGKEALYDKLCEIDESSAKRIHPNNIKKVIRAIESVKFGKKIASFENSIKPTKDYEYILIGLDRKREDLYDRINKRVDIMISNGLENEVHDLIEMGLDETKISMSGIGYKEIMAYIRGEYDLTTAVDTIKKNSRHYAKRQLSWFHRYKETVWYDITEDADLKYKEMIETIKKFLYV